MKAYKKDGPGLRLVKSFVRVRLSVTRYTRAACIKAIT